MNHSPTPGKSKGILWGVLLAILPIWANAQGKQVCEEGDCPSQVQSIQLSETLKAPPSPSRTAQFEAAFQALRDLKNTAAQTPGWTQSYRSNALTGPSCLRLNQLEGHLAHEYLINPAFQKFVDGQVPDPNAFLEAGFESTRRALNLSRRMSNHCPQELKALERLPGTPPLDQLPPVFSALGQKLGYFDEQGNLLKPLKDLPQEDPATNAPPPQKMKKKDQVAYLKEKVQALPVGAPMQQKIAALQQELNAAKPDVSALQTALAQMGAGIGQLVPGAEKLLSGINGAKGILGKLLNFKPRLPFPKLFSKIGNLFNKGKNLANRAQNLVDRAGKLKERFDGVVKKADEIGKSLQDKTQAIQKLQDQLAALDRTKTDLQAKLEDKPKKILEQLHQEVKQAEDAGNALAENVASENQEKERLLDELAKLKKEKGALEQEMNDLQKEADALAQEQQTLETETQAVQQEVEEIKRQDALRESLEKELADLKPAEGLKSELDACDNALTGLLTPLKEAERLRGKLKSRLGKLFETPERLTQQLRQVKNLHNELTSKKPSLPSAGNLFDKVTELSNKATVLGASLEILTGKRNQIQKLAQSTSQGLDQARGRLDEQVEKLSDWKSTLAALVTEKTGLKDQLARAIRELPTLETQVKDFVNRYLEFDRQSDCPTDNSLSNLIEGLKNDLENLLPEAEDFENEAAKAEQDVQELEGSTREVAQKIEDDLRVEEEVAQEEQTIQQEFGREVDLEPVKPQEWADGFEVKRPYWDAVFHPDDEVVEGYRGRYFQIRLKDADKTVKLLFGPGEYFMSKADFRDRYGSVIGAFVTEALAALKADERQALKLFLKGSADISGQNTFRGRLDKHFLYSEITVLPYEEETDSYRAEPQTRTIDPQGFTNADLPNLRGQFLKEMVSVYSRNLKPVLLEGSVTKVQNTEDRNAVIFLFIPEELVEHYGGH